MIAPTPHHPRPSLSKILSRLQIKASLPGYSIHKLESMPGRGNGLNPWTFSAAKALDKANPPLNDEQKIKIIEALTQGEPIKPGEIERAVANSKKYRGSGQNQKPRKKVNTEQRDAIIRDGGGLAELNAASHQLPGEDAEPAYNLRLLFPPNSLLCLGWSVKRFRTRPLDEWCQMDLKRMSHIVPSPMAHITGISLDGGKSQRCLNNTGPRRFLVTEFDSGEIDGQASILLHLAKRAPLVMVVHSGNKSLHGWFWAEGQSEERLRNFMAHALSLGADPATWTPCQLVRLPSGTRDNGKRQEVLFFNGEEIR